MRALPPFLRQCRTPGSRLLAALRHLAAPVAFVAASAASAASAAQGLPPAVERALREAGIAPSSAAVWVRGVDQETPLISHQSRQAMNPASVMKLVTTYAALEMLGSTYTWKTEALTETPPSASGRLDGPLYLRGSGDPRLALEQFWLLLRQLRTRGVADIGGDLILDRSAFALPPHDPAAFDGAPLRPYNVGPDALLVNLASIRLTLRPAPGNSRIDVLAETPGTEGRILNRLSPGSGSCGDWREKLQINVDNDAVILQGAYPSSCGEKTLNLAPWPANRQTEALFRALWPELGGTLRGTVRDGVTPATARVLATHESPTLAEIVREINKYSNNVMARQVFLTLDTARPATPEGADRSVRAWLAAKPLLMPELVLDNGSGLSRKERISAESLGRLLQTAWASPVMPEFMASLPVAGTDGTLRQRLGNGTSTGRAHLKTGYLGNVRALAGYAMDAAGKRWVVVFLINDPNAREGKRAMDALLEWLTSRAL